MYGITQIKILAVMIINLGESFAEKMADGKISAWEGFSLTFSLRPLPGLIKNRKELAQQAMDLDQEEIATISALVAVELELPNNPELEAKIEKAVPMGLSLLDWFGEFLDGRGTPGV